jgi:hypothetical protein
LEFEKNLPILAMIMCIFTPKGPSPVLEAQATEQWAGLTIRTAS